MIVAAGVLVAAAAVLLVVGAAGSGIALVYGSILLSLVAGVLLLVGRRRPTPGGSGRPVGPVPGPAPSEGHPDRVAPSPPVTARPDPPQEQGDALESLLEDAPAGEDPLAIVVVVPGRPRYHLDGCPELPADDDEQIGVDLDVREAREQGFTPCGTCRPDATIAEEVAAETHLSAGSVAVAGHEEADVVVLPEQGTFHTAACPVARDDPQARPAGRQQALDLGYRPCERCDP